MNRENIVKVSGDRIDCPSCHTQIRLLHHRSIGAAYAKDWETLPVNHTSFLSLWLESDFSNHWTTKHDLYHKLYSQISSLGGFGKRVPFNGRVSELVSAGTKYGAALVEKSKQVKSSPHNTVTGPFYKINIPRVRQVLAHGGHLTEEVLLA